MFGKFSLAQLSTLDKLLTRGFQRARELDGSIGLNFYLMELWYVMNDVKRELERRKSWKTFTAGN